MNFISKISLAFIIVGPLLSYAAMDNIKDLIADTEEIVASLVVVAFAMGLLVFLWGLVKFIYAVGDDPKAKENGRQLMVWGVVALFVMTSVYGLTTFIGAIFGIESGTSAPPSGISAPPSGISAPPSGGGGGGEGQSRLRAGCDPLTQSCEQEFGIESGISAPPSGGSGGGEGQSLFRSGCDPLTQSCEQE